MIRAICAALLSLSLLQAQTKLSKSNAPRHRTPDILSRLGIQKRFFGYLVSKKTGRVAFFFDGTWVQAPQITGGAPGDWSDLCAEIRDLDDPTTEPPWVMSFNLGRKGSQWLARTFKFARDPIYGRPVPATVEDEGVGAQDGATLRFDLSDWSLVLRAGEKGWEPREVKAYRFRGTTYAPTDSPAPYVGGTTRQYVPAWSAGILTIRDEPCFKGRIPLSSQAFRLILFCVRNLEIRRHSSSRLHSTSVPGLPKMRTLKLVAGFEP